MTIAEFNKKLDEYAKLSRRTPEEVLAKQGYNLALHLRAEFMKLAPDRGAVTSDRLEAIRRGEGIKVREGAREFAKRKTVSTAQNVRTRQASLFMEKTKSGNVKRGGRTYWEIAVDRELAIRESGRGHLALASRMKWVDKVLIDGFTYRVLDRVDRELSRAGLKRSSDGAILLLDFSNPRIVSAMERPRAKAALAKAISAAAVNMQIYIDRKLAEAKRKAGLN